MSPDVSVRVLSVQTTVVDPSVSTAGSRRTSAWRRAIRRMPTASAIVTTAGSASGTAATASAMPVSKHQGEGGALHRAEHRHEGRDSEGHPDQPPAERIEPRSSGVRSWTTDLDQRPDPTRPRCARRSRSRRRGRSPPATVVLLNSMLLRSASGGEASSTRLRSSTREATLPSAPLPSLADRCQDQSRIRGHVMPGRDSIRSPGTRRSASTIAAVPFVRQSPAARRVTVNASIARRALHSVAKPMAVLITSTAATCRPRDIAERRRDGPPPPRAGTRRRSTVDPRESWPRTRVSGDEPVGAEFEETRGGCVIRQSRDVVCNAASSTLPNGQAVPGCEGRPRLAAAWRFGSLFTCWVPGSDIPLARSDGS